MILLAVVVFIICEIWGSALVELYDKWRLAPVKSSTDQPTVCEIGQVCRDMDREGVEVTNAEIERRVGLLRGQASQIVHRATHEEVIRSLDRATRDLELIHSELNQANRRQQINGWLGAHMDYPPMPPKKRPPPPTQRRK